MRTVADQHVFLENYRPDIDGLRAFAVISVLLFHVGFTTFSGGFIGVDVFFVISGYLITGILIKDIELNSFSFTKFISRRFFRLYPSLVFVVFSCVILGFLFFSPAHFKELGRSSASSLFSVSNYDYYLRADYFSESSASNPLLHTWSLSVEQQFYLIFPFMLSIFYKTSRGISFFIILLVGVLSLALSQHYISSGSPLSYFSTFSRGFEFSVGVLLHWLPKRKINNALLEAFLIIGISGLLFCVIYFDKQTPFPGWHALMPCLFSGLCIYSGTAKYTGRLLSNKVSVWIGLISYSLYLVHWPILTFYNYYIYSTPSYIEKILLVITSIIFACPLYVFIENKFRRITFSTIKRFKLISLASVSLLTMSISFNTYFSDGMHWRIDSNSLGRFENATEYHSKNYGGANYSAGKIHFLGDLNSKKVSYVLFGDSFAGHLTAGLDSLLKERGLKAAVIWSSGCFVGVKYVSTRNGSPKPECLEVSKLAIELLSKYDATIIYAQSWSAYQVMLSNKRGDSISFSNPSEYYELIFENINDLLVAAGKNKKIIIFGSPPGDGSKKGLSIKACLERPIFIPSECQDKLVFPESEGAAFSDNIGISNVLVGLKNVHFINPYSFFCTSGKCRPIIKSEVLYSDYAHLSISGSKSLMKHFSDDVLE
ncbi:acyltransferase family protein [Aeromonas sp. s5]|uniref:acyltransferase family protein n=1 Tax=Aeromonas sp. s5 TaxID=3138487 RepID=UPI0034A173FB